MADKKKEILSLDPFDVLSEVVTGEIFDLKRFSGIALPEVVKEGKEEDGADKRESRSDSGERGRDAIRNPFKPATSKEKAGKTEERRSATGTGAGQSDKPEQDKSDGDKPDKDKSSAE